jgi:3-deoxy-D-manno-octulosonic-acid transferase
MQANNLKTKHEIKKKYKGQEQKMIEIEKRQRKMIFCISCFPEEENQIMDEN